MSHMGVSDGSNKSHWSSLVKATGGQFDNLVRRFCGSSVNVHNLARGSGGLH